MASRILGILILCTCGGMIFNIQQTEAKDTCPPKCSNSCKYNQQGHITEAKCSDIPLRSLPLSLIKLYVVDATSPYTLPLGRFQNFALGKYDNMEILKIETYKIQNLQGHCFEKVPNLVSLDLSKNEITAVSEENFSGLTKLTYLNLNQNKLHAISANAFRNLTTLKELHIALNSIETLGEHDFTGLDNITKINLQSNNISTIHENTFNFLTKLEDINLQQNQLTTIIANLFQNMTNLKTINLQINRIQVLDPLSMIGTHLVLLKMSRNDLLEIPTDFLKNIGNVNLTVNFAINKITEIEDCDFNGVILGTLYLVSNQISLIHPDALQNSFIEKLDLQQNLLHHIPAGLQKDINQSNSILLANNPWSCDCDIQWVKSLLQSANQEPTCAEPRSYFGSKISSVLNDLQLTCNNGRNPLPAPTKILPIPPKQNLVTPRLNQKTTCKGHHIITITSQPTNTLKLLNKGDNATIWPIIVGVSAGVVLLIVLIALLTKFYFCKTKVAPDPALKVSRAELNHKPCCKFQPPQNCWNAVV